MATQTTGAAGPLEGLLVIEVGDEAELAGKLLADAGADVIRVEPRAGARSRHAGPYVGDRPDTNQSLRFAAVNTSKRSVTLDLGSAEGAALWAELVARSEVVLDGTGPGALDEAGLGPARFRAERPSLIWCAVTPFGLTGPWRDWASSDLVQLALGGPMMSTGYDDHDLPPIRSDGEHSIAMSNEYAVTAVLAALWLRDEAAGATPDSSGPGQLIDVSMHEAVSATTEGAFPNWEFLGQQVIRQTGRHAAAQRNAPWQYKCTDGDYILLMGGGVPRDGKIFVGLLEWMDEHDAAGDLHDPKYVQVLYTDPTINVEVRNHVAVTIGKFVQGLTAEEAYRRGQSLHLPWGLVRRPEQNLDDPHWEAREFWWTGEVPGHPDPVRYPGAPYKFAASPVRMRRRPPLLGEHNTEVYVGELGRTTDELQHLAAAGAI
ncbi:MAG: CoA transferase [Chloroflexi bacterium]|nr:CoA transferase [Chloroflexota bacterium]MDA1147399.1 CoA transferase [Chloroflexota bacterium]